MKKNRIRPLDQHTCVAITAEFTREMPDNEKKIMQEMQRDRYLEQRHLSKAQRRRKTVVYHPDGSLTVQNTFLNEMSYAILMMVLLCSTPKEQWSRAILGFSVGTLPIPNLVFGIPMGFDVFPGIKMTVKVQELVDETYIRMVSYTITEACTRENMRIFLSNHYTFLFDPSYLSLESEVRRAKQILKNAQRVMDLYRWEGGECGLSPRLANDLKNNPLVLDVKACNEHIILALKKSFAELADVSVQIDNEWKENFEVLATSNLNSAVKFSVGPRKSPRVLRSNDEVKKEQMIADKLALFGLTLPQMQAKYPAIEEKVLFAFKEAVVNRFSDYNPYFMTQEKVAVIRASSLNPKMIPARLKTHCFPIVSDTFEEIMVTGLALAKEKRALVANDIDQLIWESSEIKRRVDAKGYAETIRKMPERFASLFCPESAFVKSLQASHTEGAEIKEKLNESTALLAAIKSGSIELGRKKKRSILADEKKSQDCQAELEKLQGSLSLLKTESITLQKEFSEVYLSQSTKIMEALEKKDTVTARRLKRTLDVLFSKQEEILSRANPLYTQLHALKEWVTKQVQKEQKLLNASQKQALKEQELKLKAQEKQVEQQKQAELIKQEEVAQKAALKQEKEEKKKNSQRMQEERKQRADERKAEEEKQRAAPSPSPLPVSAMQKDEAKSYTPARPSPFTLESKVQLKPKLAMRELQEMLFTPVDEMSPVEMMIAKNAILGTCARLMEEIKQARGFPVFPEAMAKRFRDVIFHGHELAFYKQLTYNQVKDMVFLILFYMNSAKRMEAADIIFTKVKSNLFNQFMDEKSNPILQMTDAMRKRQLEIGCQELEAYNQSSTLPDFFRKAACGFTDARLNTYGTHFLNTRQLSNVVQPAQYDAVIAAIGRGAAYRHCDPIQNAEPASVVAAPDAFFNRPQNRALENQLQAPVPAAAPGGCGQS